MEEDDFREGDDSECHDSPWLEEQHTKLHRNFYNLKTRITNVQGSLRNGNFTLDEISDDVGAMARDLNGLEDYVRYRLHPKYYNEIRKEDSNVAERVFGIPELLENILLNLNISGIISMERTSSTIRDIIVASPKLQVELYLKPEVQDSTTKYINCRSPFNGHDQPHANFEVFPFPGGLEAEFTRLWAGGPPKITNRMAKMLICQPPVKHMYLSRVCARCYSTDEDSKGKITSDTGLTVGDLYDRAKPLLTVRHPWATCTDPAGGATFTETEEVEFTHEPEETDLTDAEAGRI